MPSGSAVMRIEKISICRWFHPRWRRFPKLLHYRTV